MRWLQDLEILAVLEAKAMTTYCPSLVETAFRDYVDGALREARLLLHEGGWPIILRHNLLKVERQILGLRVLAGAAADAREMLRDRYGLGAPVEVPNITP
jgi:hypothetical protein